MPTNTSGTAAANLTQLEHLALDASLNLADGHARQSLSETQQRIVDDLPTLFAKSVDKPVDELERAAHEAYFATFGQHSYPDGPARVLSCYASSVAMEILARSLATSVPTIGLVHPTFDNIPDILRGFGLQLLPVDEEALHGGDLAAAVSDEVGCLFVTTPNNPTGRVLAEHRLAVAARLCAERDIVLALDTSFRGFDARAHYDHYLVLEGSGCRYVVIEDTGKLWPTLDLKVGLLVSSAHVGLPLAQIHSDILLGVSPFVLALVEQFALDAAAGGLDELTEHIAGNRRVLRETLADVPGVSFPDEDSRVSVERVEVRDRDGVRLWEQLSERKVYVLPCRQFHWADPESGTPYLRVALARDRATVAAAAEAIRAFLLEQ
ncbi:MAG: enduracididine biosynthesis enzyme MppP [Sciscionella sp.]